MLPFVLAFAISMVVTLLVVHGDRVHGLAARDDDFSGPQKFHARAVPRIGGVGIAAGLAASLMLLSWRQQPADHLPLWLLACGAPTFLVGLTEDLTKRVSPRVRLLFTAFAAAAASVALGATITYTTIPGLDWFVSFPAGALLLTVFAVAGVANSINIIDGFNGLASMCVMLMLGALAYVGYQVEDPLVAAMAITGAGAVLGFFIWNYPAGLIFLGDGGAYFLGFYVAELSILLIIRNADEVSPLFPLLVCIYPVFETVFSIYRRRFLRAVPPHMPDGIHLHSLVYRRLLRWAVGNRSAKALTRRNSMTSPYLWLLCMLSLIPAMFFYDDTRTLASFIVAFAVTYILLYWRIVRFRSPRWLRPRWLMTTLRGELDSATPAQADNERT